MREAIKATDANIDYSNIDRHLHRQVEAAAEAGYADKPNGERVSCACGYSGPPEVILRLEDWEMSDSEWDLMVCPNCGDA